MQKVTKAEFFSAIGNGDIHPRPVVETFRGRFFTSMWEEQKTRKLVGKSINDSYGINGGEYYLIRK